MHYVELTASLLTLFATVFFVVINTTEAYYYYFGFPAIYRVKEDSVKRAVFIIDPTLKAKTPGIVTGWNVYTTRGRRSQVAQLQIWRPTGEMRYTLVGQTIFVAQWVGHNYVPIKPEFRIHMEPSDVIGLYFPKYNPVPWSSIECTGENRQLFLYHPKNMQVGVEYKFSHAKTDWKPCREYSLNATVMNHQDSHYYDATSPVIPNNRGQHGDYFPTRRPISSGAPVCIHTSCFLLVILTSLLSKGQSVLSSSFI